MSGMPGGADSLRAMATMAHVVGATSELDELVDAVLGALDDLFGFSCSLLLLHDGHTEELFTLASHGYETQGIGSEVPLGIGIIGIAAARRAPMRLSNVRRQLVYARSARRSAEEQGAVLVPEIPLPGLAAPESQMAVPMLSGGALIGVLAVETAEPLSAYDERDEDVLVVIAQMTAKAIVAERALAGDAAGQLRVPGGSAAPAPPPLPQPSRCRVRHFASDGSTFLDDDYLIRGVAGRLLWKLLCEQQSTGRTEFTNREVRLDPELQLPEYRDNFESRLTLLKRRLDEREAPVRICSTGRGRFRLDTVVDVDLDLQ